ncbi:MAG: hypothetical protein JNM68_04195 [Dinghuibacter sp.]|nr:hypothetical protein [Dinghuibacter sp.]
MKRVYRVIPGEPAGIFLCTGAAQSHILTGAYWFNKMKQNNFFALLAIFILMGVLFRDCRKERVVYISTPQPVSAPGYSIEQRGSYKTTNEWPEQAPGSTTGTVRKQCLGKTVKGLRCRNKTRNVHGYCWIHE